MKSILELRADSYRLGSHQGNGIFQLLTDKKVDGLDGVTNVVLHKATKSSLETAQLSLSWSGMPKEKLFLLGMRSEWTRQEVRPDNWLWIDVTWDS